MFEVSVEHTFAAAHNLRNYHGKCERLHGHNYKVQVRVEGDSVDRAGMVIDFVELKRDLREITERLDHNYLNEIEPFTELSPSAENIAKYLFDELDGKLRKRPEGERSRISEVRVWETDIQYAAYRR